MVGSFLPGDTAGVAEGLGELGALTTERVLKT